MLISLNWLKQYVDIEGISIEELDNTLTMIGQEVEKIDIKGKEYTQNTSTYTEGNLTIDADKVTLNGNGTQAKDIRITGDLNTEERG